MNPKYTAGYINPNDPAPQPTVGPFDQHTLSPEGVKRVAAVRAVFKAAAEELKAHVPQGREFALVMTNLQQASMWATRGVAVAHNTDADNGNTIFDRNGEG